MPAYLLLVLIYYIMALVQNVTAEYYFRTVIGLYRVPFTFMPLVEKGNPNTSIIRSGNTLWKADIGWNSKAAGKEHFLGANIHGGIYDLENKKTDIMVSS